MYFVGGGAALKSDVKVINHCLSVRVSVREISGIGHHKSCAADSALRLHSSGCYRFIVLKSHSVEWLMRAADCLLLTSSREVGLLSLSPSQSLSHSLNPTLLLPFYSANRRRRLCIFSRRISLILFPSSSKPGVFSICPFPSRSLYV